MTEAIQKPVRSKTGTSSLERQKALPSQESFSRWILARGPMREPSKRDLYGKWMIFVPTKIVDDVWLKVKTELEGGILSIVSPAAKVSTPNPDQPKSHVIIVYTSDHRDVDTVRRCLIALRSIGIKGRLYYKADQQTRAGVYAGGKDRPWLYNSDKFET